MCMCTFFAGCLKRHLIVAPPEGVWGPGERKKWWWWDTFIPSARWRRDRKSPKLHFWQVESQLQLMNLLCIVQLCKGSIMLQKMCFDFSIVECYVGPYCVFSICIFLSPSSLIPGTTTTPPPSSQPLILHIHPPEPKDITKSSGILLVHILVFLELSCLAYLYQVLKSKIWKLIIIIELKMSG